MTGGWSSGLRTRETPWTNDGQLVSRRLWRAPVAHSLAGGANLAANQFGGSIDGMRWLAADDLIWLRRHDERLRGGRVGNSLGRGGTNC